MTVKSLCDSVRSRDFYFIGHFARKKGLKLEMAPVHNSSESKKLQPNMSPDERLNICAQALLNNSW